MEYFLLLYFTDQHVMYEQVRYVALICLYNQYICTALPLR